MSYIFPAAEVEANADFISDRKLHGAILARGELSVALGEI